MKLGKVQVIGGADNEVLAELGPGAVFGEIRYCLISCPTPTALVDSLQSLMH